MCWCNDSVINDDDDDDDNNNKNWPIILVMSIFTQLIFHDDNDKIMIK